MKTYVVQAAKKPSQLTASWSKASRRAAGIQAHKDITKELRGIVEKFAAEHAGKVIVDKDDFWAGLSINVQTTPALAEKLRKVKGIGSVLVLVPSKVTLEKETGKPGPSSAA